MKIKRIFEIVFLKTVSVYERDGVYQIYTKAMEEDGVGDLYQKFQELKSNQKTTPKFLSLGVVFYFIIAS